MREYVDFLGSQPPYDVLEAPDLEALAHLIEVEYFVAGTIIVAAGATRLKHFYVVRSGEVEVVDRGRVVDVLGPGETFGQISVVWGLPPPLTVTSPPDPRAADALADQLVDPQAVVGQYVRRRGERAPHRFTPWGHIAMTVPSVSGLCWLVCFFDGGVDVWRVDDAAAQYEFHCASDPQKGGRS